MFAKIFTTVLAAVAAASAASLHLSRATLDVIDLPVVHPAAGDVWHVGDVQTVTWDTAPLPSNEQDKTGMILLGFYNHTSTDPTNEHLDTQNPLANGFLLSAGQINVTVPDKPELDSYFLVLFGDSGNTSGEFTIAPAEAQ